MFWTLEMHVAQNCCFQAITTMYGPELFMPLNLAAVFSHPFCFVCLDTGEEQLRVTFK